MLLQYFLWTQKTSVFKNSTSGIRTSFGRCPVPVWQWISWILVWHCAWEIVPFLLRLSESRRTHTCTCHGLHVTHPVCSKLPWLVRRRGYTEQTPQEECQSFCQVCRPVFWQTATQRLLQRGGTTPCHANCQETKMPDSQSATTTKVLLPPAAQFFFECLSHKTRCEKTRVSCAV